jgi:threonine synthase
MCNGDRYPAGQLYNLSKASKPVLVRYDLERLARSVTKQELAARPAGMGRYREFLPVERAENFVSLGEVETPLVECNVLGRRLGAERLVIKDESRLPTGSFKAGGLCMAVSMAKELG